MYSRTPCVVLTYIQPGATKFLFFPGNFHCRFFTILSSFLLQAYFEAVREAQRVTVDAIPMPDGPLGLGGEEGALPADIPLPAPAEAGSGGAGGGKGGNSVAPFSLKIQAKPATGILKPSNALKSTLPAELIAKKRKNPPGRFLFI